MEPRWKEKKRKAKTELAEWHQQVDKYERPRRRFIDKKKEWRLGIVLSTIYIKEQHILMKLGN